MIKKIPFWNLHFRYFFPLLFLVISYLRSTFVKTICYSEVEFHFTTWNMQHSELPGSYMWFLIKVILYLALVALTFKFSVQQSWYHCSEEAILCHNWSFYPDCKIFQSLSCISLSSPPCSKPARPEHACDIQQNQSASQHSLTSSTYSNHQTNWQALFYPRWLHLPRKAPLNLKLFG